MKAPVFFMDMDGVITDFVGATLKLFGTEYKPEEWPKGQYSIEVAMKIEQSEMWERIGAAHDFWENLSELQEGVRLYQQLSVIGKVVFLTSPCRDPRSSAGKVTWLLDRFGPKFRDYILTSEKHYCAGNGILIDDYDEKVDKFRENGGLAILYPQPWNTNYDLQYDRNGYVFDQIEKISYYDNLNNWRNG